MVLSYDVGAEKPEREIFDAAKQMLGETLRDASSGEGAQRADEFEMLFVGDDLEKDVLGARDAGWNSVLLDREGRYGERFEQSVGGGAGLVTIDASEEDGTGAARGRNVQVVQDLRALGQWRPSERLEGP